MKATNIVTSLLEFIRAPFARRQEQDISTLKSLEERVRILEAEIKSLKSRPDRGVSGSPMQTHSGRGGKEKS